MLFPYIQRIKEILAEEVNCDVDVQTQYEVRQAKSNKVEDVLSEVYDIYGTDGVRLAEEATNIY
jgi:hypothetical protein